MNTKRKSDFKRVPALDKCFGILDLLSKSSQPLGISEICKKLNLNKSTVFNMVHTLADLNVLEQIRTGKFGFGTRLYLLSNGAGRRADVIRIVHPYLERIAGSSNFSAFFGIRSQFRAVIMDKVDADIDIRVTAEVGMRLPLFAGAGGKALLSQLPDSQLERMLSDTTLTKFTPHTCMDMDLFREAVLKVREEGIALDWEEYIEGIVAVAVPINTHREGREAAIWAVGLKRRESRREVSELSQRLKMMAKELDIRFQPGQPRWSEKSLREG